MPSDFANLQAAIDAITAQADATKTTEDGAEALINGFAAQVTKAVSDALTADKAANDASIAAATAAIEATRTKFADSAAALGAAVANVPPAA